MKKTHESINAIIQAAKILEMDTNHVSDGYHTFGELYEHRIVIYIALCRIYEHHCSDTQWKTTEGRKNFVWKSRAHSDGSVWDGWFIMGIGRTKGEQITYHLPESKWNDCAFAETLDKAPEWDGHTSADVLERLMRL